MQRETFEEAVKGVGAAGCEVGAEAVATDVLEFVFVGKGRDGALRVVF